MKLLKKEDVIALASLLKEMRPDVNLQSLTNRIEKRGVVFADSSEDPKGFVWGVAGETMLTQEKVCYAVIYVAKAHRGKGIGKGIVNSLKNYSEAKGADALILSANDPDAEKAINSMGAVLDELTFRIEI